MSSENTSRLAVLIDADNAQPSITEGLLAEIAKYGTAHVKRAYGDWTRTNLRGWKEQLLAQSIQPIQQFAYTRGKNATDAAMVIDAMDLLYSGRFDGFCLVSSDSDFTRLAARLRESGLTVYGFGERKTPKPFVAACDKFIYTENLGFDVPDEDADDSDEVADEVHGAGEAGGAHAANGSTAARAGTAGSKRSSRASAAQLKSDAKLVTLLRNAAEAASDDDGWAMLSAVGEIITKQRPDFDSRSYGYAKLSDLIDATTLFETERRSPGDGKQAVIYLRDKRRRSAAKKARVKLAL
ncbi:MAG TPA: NYN domain-containing protein [Trebonia sp.]